LIRRRNSLPIPITFIIAAGRFCCAWGEKKKARKKPETSIRMDNERRAQREKQVESATLASPELTEDER
jgi:hypothetical protein